MFRSAVTFPYVSFLKLHLPDALSLFKNVCTYFTLSLCGQLCVNVVAKEIMIGGEQQAGNVGNLSFQEVQMLVSGATQRSIKPHTTLWRAALASTGTKGRSSREHLGY